MNSGIARRADLPIADGDARPITRRCATRPARAIAFAALTIAIAIIAVLTFSMRSAAAQTTDTTPGGATVSVPTVDVPGGTDTDGSATVSLDVGETIASPSQSVTIVVLLTLIAVAPSLLIMMTSFTRIVIVLSLTRQALGLQAVPPNQVMMGLALFLSFFVMSPTLSAMNEEAVKPYMAGAMTASQAFDAGQKPLKEFMLSQTREDELAMFISLAEGERPESPDDVSLTALAPAFMLSELKTAFIIGFVVFVPFLVIDLVTSASLMSLGMMMLPPTLIALPFKLLLFVLVDGWALVVESLLNSFKT